MGNSYQATKREIIDAQSLYFGYHSERGATFMQTLGRTLLAFWPGKDGWL